MIVSFQAQKAYDETLKKRMKEKRANYDQNNNFHKIRRYRYRSIIG